MHRSPVYPSWTATKSPGTSRLKVAFVILVTTRPRVPEVAGAPGPEPSDDDPPVSSGSHLLWPPGRRRVGRPPTTGRPPRPRWFARRHLHHPDLTARSRRPSRTGDKLIPDWEASTTHVGVPSPWR